jgi:hypothetical protein
VKVSEYKKKLARHSLPRSGAECLTMSFGEKSHYEKRMLVTELQQKGIVTAIRLQGHGFPGLLDAHKQQYRVFVSF